MSVARHHAEWLLLVDASGPFLSMPVLLRVFPQGLERRNSAKASRLREAYEDWLGRGGKSSAVHHAWISYVLTEILEYPPTFLAAGQAIPPGMEAVIANYGETLRPDFVLQRPDVDEQPLLLIRHYDPAQDLEKPVTGKTWKASPVTRMTELLHSAGVPLGLVTNGEQWTLVYAPRGETTGFASWYADLWMQEPITLRAFHSLLQLRRFLGVAEPETLAALFAESAKDQQEVTEQLGYQVRRAVEMLVQAFAAIEAEPDGRALLTGVSEKDLYDGALTLMMRLVFLFCAEERKLLLLGDPLYDQHYAVSTLSEILRERADQQGEEVLERRHDAWCRLLATFRVVHTGVEHDAMRLPPYGGRLFDPDAYPFLEGRLSNTRWRDTPASPLPINNRVVLHLLEALQLLRVKVPGGGPAEARRLSFRSLDIEQIGHVYEGLLDHTAKRAGEVILGLAGGRNSEREIPLAKLETLAADGTAALVEFLQKETGRSAATLKRLVEKPLKVDDHALLIACGQDARLLARVKPFAGLVREDDFGQPVVIQPGSIYVTRGSDRRSTGTHYTPRSLTEPIVQHTLEPLVYRGPAAGDAKAAWELKSPREILALKVCDLTMGSGAFLVEACRYLAERLVEAWEIAERANPGKILATPEGDFSAGDPKERLIPADAAERLAIARRYVADRCLYGVDINPMAVEMAKLSLWLITLQRDRPFTFLDHALKCGDSLLGVSSVEQIENFSLRPGERQVTFATANLFSYVGEAAEKRRKLEGLPSNDHLQIETKNRLHTEAEAATAKVKALADALIAFELCGLSGDVYESQRTDEAERVQLLLQRADDASRQSPISNLQSALATHAREQLRDRRPFHWAVEFPEVFAQGGFDAFVGNPPFMVAFKVAPTLGAEIVTYLKSQWPRKGRADLSAYFLLRAGTLLRVSGCLGLITTKTIAQEDNRRVALDYMEANGFAIYRAVSNMPWPGLAAVHVCVLHTRKGSWGGEHFIDGKLVEGISTGLESKSTALRDPRQLACFPAAPSKGTTVNGTGFILTAEEALRLIEANATNRDVIRHYLNGAELNDSANGVGPRYIVDFGELNRSEAERYSEPWGIVESRVAPTREAHRFQVHEEDFWKFSDKRPGLYHSLRGIERAIVFSLVSKYFAFSFAPADQLFSSSLGIVPTTDAAVFGTLQSTIHVTWAQAHQYSFKADPRYSIGRCYRTFPFLDYGADVVADLRSKAEDFHASRRAAMEQMGIGLRVFYDRFHDPGEHSEDIARLRALHVEMDQAVAAAYDWSDLDLGHGFHATKPGERFTISESARRKVLDRLLGLNHERYQQESKAGLHAKRGKGKSRTRRKVKGKPPSTEQQDLPAMSADGSQV